MSDETNERYFMVISSGMVEIMDAIDQETAGIFTGPDRLLIATAELNRLNAKPEITPAAFLAETLPAKARRQRLEAHLREVIEIGDALSAVLAADAANLKRAIALREKLEKELASPLSSTLPAQNAPEVLADAEERLDRYMDAWERQGQYPAIGQMPDFFKPGPY